MYIKLFEQFIKEKFNNSKGEDWNGMAIELIKMFKWSYASDFDISRFEKESSGNRIKMKSPSKLPGQEIYIIEKMLKLNSYNVRALICQDHYSINTINILFSVNGKFNTAFNTSVNIPSYIGPRTFNGIIEDVIEKAVDDIKNIVII